MSRGRALLLATILSIACAAPASGALAAANGETRSPKLDPVATIAHAGAGHRKHARAACKSQAKRKGHGKRAHARARKCARRAKHAKRSRSETSVTVGSTPAATIAKVLGTPCENTELMPQAGNLEAVGQATVCLVNQERARNGELPLQVSAQLAQAAEGHSAEMLEDDYFAHVSPGGETPLQRVEATGYIPNSQVGYTLGENIAWGTLYMATPRSIVAAWIASPEHLANILNGTYKETAVGVAPDAPPSLAEGEPGAIYTQEFGVIES
jgi:uncharacterized protein YkwD